MSSSSASRGPDPSAPGPSGRTTLPAKCQYPFCSNLSITEELVKDFVEHAGVNNLGDVRHGLQLCNHGLALELWEILDNKFKTKSKLFKAEILGKILFQIFRPNFEPVSAKLLLTRVTRCISNKQKTCKVPRKGGGRIPKRKRWKKVIWKAFTFMGPGLVVKLQATWG